MRKIQKNGQRKQGSKKKTAEKQQTFEYSGKAKKKKNAWNREIGEARNGQKMAKKFE